MRCFQQQPVRKQWLQYYLDSASPLLLRRMWMRKQQQWLQFRLLARSDSSVLLRRMEQQRLWMRLLTFFQSSQMFGQKKPRVRINRPGAFFHQNSLSAKPFRFPCFSFPLFHLFSFFFFSHTFQIYFIKGIPFEYLFSFCCFFSIHFPAVSFFFLPLIICFFPPSVIFSGLEHKIKRNKKTNAGMLPGRILI